MAVLVISHEIWHAPITTRVNFRIGKQGSFVDVTWKFVLPLLSRGKNIGKNKAILLT